MGFRLFQRLAPPPQRVMSMVAQLEAYVRNVYWSAIGRPRRELVTPALILDLDVARRNIQFMARRLSGMKAKLRPHV
ncbi:MAG: hypothetical protein DMG10_31360, partial [Acidobacteria bacterium]